MPTHRTDAPSGPPRASGGSAEPFPRGTRTDAASIAELVQPLLGAVDATDDATLSELGVGLEDLDDLWDAVRVEFVEQGHGPDLEPGELDLSMAVAEAARTMASLLGVGRGTADGA